MSFGGVLMCRFGMLAGGFVITLFVMLGRCVVCFRGVFVVLRCVFMRIIRHGKTPWL